MKTTLALVKRNMKLFFKDKGMFFTSLITPAILLILYTTFLGNVFRDSFAAGLPEGFAVSERTMGGLVGGQLVSSLLAVSCVTVAFCSNFLMVQDKSTGCVRDFRISPVRPSVLALSYYVASFLSTLLICFAAAGICFLYLAFAGWCLTVTDVLLLLADVALLVLFGTALSSVINFFLTTQGQVSAVGTVVSAGYGFICGAYMPVSSFGVGLRRVISFLPGTYGTGLVSNHAMNGALEQLQNEGVPGDAVASIRDAVDCNLYFFEKPVSVPVMYLILTGSVAVLILLYVLLNRRKKRT